MLEIPNNFQDIFNKQSRELFGNLNLLFGLYINGVYQGLLNDSKKDDELVSEGGISEEGCRNYLDYYLGGVKLLGVIEAYVSLFDVTEEQFYSAEIVIGETSFTMSDLRKDIIELVERYKPYAKIASE